MTHMITYIHNKSCQNQSKQEKMGWSEGSEVEAERMGVQPRGGQRYVLARAAERVFFHLSFYPPTSLAGSRSTAADITSANLF